MTAAVTVTAALSLSPKIYAKTAENLVCLLAYY